MIATRGWVLAVAVVAGILAAPAWGQKATSMAAKPVPAQDVASVAGGDVMAIVDGVALPMDKLVNILLVSADGLPVARELIATELVRKEAVKHNLVVGLDDIKAEHDLTLQLPAMFGAFRDPEQREQLFHKYLEERHITLEQWNMAMERNAILRQLARGRVTITEEELQTAFGIKYDRKAVVRHLQVARLSDAETALKDLEGGATFDELVRMRSTNPSRLIRDGLLDPISAKSAGLPPALKEAALGLKKIGQLSNVIQAGTAFHILKLEQIVEPEKVKFADVKDALHKDLFEQKVQELHMKVLAEIIQQAEQQKKIVYVNPILADLDKQEKAAARQGAK